MKSENIVEGPQNKMGYMPIPKLILNMSLPMMFSMFILALYNIVDSIFVSKINEDALTAVSLAFPVQNLMTSFAVGTGVGVNALLSRRLGERNHEEANKTANHAIFLAICTAVVFIVIGYFALPIYLKSQTSNQAIIEYGLQYLRIVVYCCPVMFVGITCDRLLQSTGRTVYTMWSQIAAAVTNTIFDPLFIFGIGFFPKLGVTGAAVATILGQFVGLVVSFTFNITKNIDIKLSFKRFRPERKIVGEIYKVGIPSILLSSITSVTTYFMNLILGAFTSTAIAVYGVYFKLNSFVFMPVFGLNGGIVPILAYNYGAKKKDRIYQTIKASLLMACGIMLFGTAIFEIFPAVLLKLFSASDSMLEIGVPAMRIIASSFIGAAFAISFSSVFQAFGKAIWSMIISFARQVIVFIPVAYLFSKTGNLNLIWLCFPIAEVMSVSLALIYMGKLNKTVLKPLAKLEEK